MRGTVSKVTRKALPRTEQHTERERDTTHIPTKPHLLQARPCLPQKVTPTPAKPYLLIVPHGSDLLKTPKGDTVHHGGKTWHLRQLVTPHHPQSGSRQRWILVLSSLLFWFLFYSVWEHMAFLRWDLWKLRHESTESCRLAGLNPVKLMEN